MGIFKKKINNQDLPKWKIKKECLNLIFECAKSTYPNEFGGLLRIDSNKKDTLTELVILPGTVSGDSHAIFKMHMLPIDFTIENFDGRYCGPECSLQSDIPRFKFDELKQKD